MASQRSKIVVTYERYGQTRRRVVDESDYRVVEHIFNLGRPFAPSPFPPFRRRIGNPIDLVGWWDGDGRVQNLVIPRLGNPIPESLLNLDSLSALTIDCRDLNSVANYIPDTFRNLNWLSRLTINLGSGDALPVTISELPKLFFLEIYAETTFAIPAWITTMHRLNSLIVHLKNETGPRSVTFPATFELKGMLFCGVDQVVHHEDADSYPSIEYLTITDSSLLRSFSGRLPNLDAALMLDEVSIDTLPDEIGDFPSLTRLGITGTEITNLPTSIGNLTNLRILLLKGSSITKLPDEIGHLTNLEEVDLTFTRLQNLPPSVANLTRLRRLHLNREMLNNFSQDRLRQLVEDLPLLGCLGYGAKKHICEPQTYNDLETPKNRSVAHALMRNRLRKRMKSLDLSSFPVALFPLIMKRAKHLVRPYSCDGLNEYHCWCCRYESISESDVFFELLRDPGPTIITGGQVKEPLSGVTMIANEQVDGPLTGGAIPATEGQVEEPLSGAVMIANEQADGPLSGGAIPATEGQVEGPLSGGAMIANGQVEGAAAGVALTN